MKRIIVISLLAFVASFTIGYTTASAKYANGADAATKATAAQDCGCATVVVCAGETWPSGYVCCAEGVPCRYYRHKYFVVCLATGAMGYECSCAYWCAVDQKSLEDFLKRRAG